MDFSISQRTTELLARFRDFVEREVIPLEREAVGKSFGQLLPELKKRRQAVKNLGLWGPQIPQEYGGLGLGIEEQALVWEELGRSPYGHFCFNAQAPDAGNMEILHAFGTKEQQERWLRPLAKGEIRSCFSMTEPDRPGSNPVWMETTAVRDGEDYVINGRKWFTSSAEGAAIAVVMAVTDPKAEPHRRASQIIVPTDTAGFERVRNISCMGEAGEDWESHAEVVYGDCRVPCSNRLGEEGAGFAIAQARLGTGRIHHCMRWIGVAERCLELMCRRAVQRRLGPAEDGNEQRLGERQTIQNWIAESRAEVDAARLMVLQAGWKMDREGSKAARTEISTIKFYVAEVMLRVIDRAIQTHGALGISDDTILAKFYRQERASRIYDGPDEVHKSVVARRMLRKYGLKSEIRNSKFETRDLEYTLMELDGAGAVREGEGLELMRLEKYLRERLPGAVGHLTVSQFLSGYSNLTYLLEIGGREYVLRRPPFGNAVRSAHDMGREYRVLSKLWEVYPAAPRPHLYCEDESVLGAPFYLMERKRGVILRRNAPTELASDGQKVRLLSENLVDQLVALHDLDYESIGLGDLGRPEGFVERQISGWARRYEKAKTNEVPEMGRVEKWLRDKMPRESGAALIHNDFKYDNLVLDASDLTTVLAVLDWEMATVGDPLMDLGVALSYWVQADDPPALQESAFGPTMLSGSLTREEWVGRYEEKSGRQVGFIAYYYAYGLFKLVVIVQQIYARYVRGHTQDARFAHLDRIVRCLAESALRVTESGRL